MKSPRILPKRLGNRLVGKRKTHAIIKILVGLLAVEAVFFLTLLSRPVIAHASLFSIIAEFLGRQKASASELIVKNSQTIPLLKAAVNLNPNPPRGGGDITIVGRSALLPESGPAGTLADIGEESPYASGQISIYVVKEGNTLSEIAEMFRVSVNTIRWANDLSPGEPIKIGQTLIILPISGIRHQVKEGDTLSSIAKRYGADLKDITQYNNMPADTKLTVDSIIIVPEGEISEPSQRSAPQIASPHYEGYYIRPIDGGRKTQGLHGYNGVDLAAPEGTPIYSAAGGRVIVSKILGWNGGYGKYIVVEHLNGTQTLYAHLLENLVFSGTEIARGQIIGYVGNTGKSTGPHLHFEIRGARNPF